jgi:hypothetical protein
VNSAYIDVSERPLLFVIDVRHDRAASSYAEAQPGP